MMKRSQQSSSTPLFAKFQNLQLSLDKKSLIKGGSEGVIIEEVIGA